VALYLTEDDVDRLVDMPAAIAAVEEAFAAKARGEAANAPRLRLPLLDGNYNVMAATWSARGVVGMKAFTAGPKGVALSVYLFDAAGDGLLAIVEGRRLTQLRTGAASGVATRYLRPGARSVGLIGTGIQAMSQLEAIVHVTGATSARVFGRDVRKRAAFAERASEHLRIDVAPVESVDACIAGAEIVVTVTNAAEPVLSGARIAPGVHVVAAGSNSWMRAEVDVELVERSAIVVVDDVAQAGIECGDLMRAAELGRFAWASAIELGDVVIGRRPVERAPTDITLFESQGIALEDLAVADLAYTLAHRHGLGRSVP
jgi:ornithine cyclodeaminase/alanine dehydrogenase-like protein (mu-crystallin family)